MPDENGWGKAEQLVLHELERLSKTMETVLSVVNDIKAEYVTKQDFQKLEADFAETKVEFATFKATQRLRNGMISALTSTVMAAIVGLAVAWLSK